MYAFKENRNFKKILPKFTIFSIWLVLLLVCQKDDAAPFGGNFEVLRQLFKNGQIQRLRSIDEGQWTRVQHHPLFMRYHGLGSDFSARSDLIDPDHKHRNDDDGGDQFPAMEVKALSDRP